MAAIPRNLRFLFGWSESDLTEMWGTVQRIGRAQEKLTDDQLYVEGLDQKFGQDFSNLRQRLQHAETELAHVLRQAGQPV